MDEKANSPLGPIAIPPHYRAALGLYETQVAIKTLKDVFQGLLAKRLNLLRVTAPLFVDQNSGLNDNLTGKERPVSFDIPHCPDQNPASGPRIGEIVHSLAKWKRYALKKYGFALDSGLYTDMNAIRRDEEVDAIHSIYVDQWDWEKIITKEQRNLAHFQAVVKDIYQVLRLAEKNMAVHYDYIQEILPPEIFFITSGELALHYPELSPKEREYRITKEMGAVCIMQIGSPLADGQPHDHRAPDYDDWSLNGDILVYYPLLDIALEISSMGIRVDREALLRQLEQAGCPERASLPFQQGILDESLPLTIGGGLGQSRICMFILRKAHIGEVQSSLWPQRVTEAARAMGLELL